MLRISLTCAVPVVAAFAPAVLNVCPAPMPLSDTCSVASNCRRVRSRISMQVEPSADEIDGWGGTLDGGTFFASWDGRDAEGISPEGALPPGDDLIEDDLRQLFSLESEDGMLDGTEMDDLQLMWKLRKELGDEDFARIFEDPKVKGPDVK